MTAYGKCPICNCPGVKAERSPYGMTECENGHRYPHGDRVPDAATAKPAPCKHGTCGSCGVAVHPWCYEASTLAPLPGEVEEASEGIEVYLDDVVHPSRPYGEYCEQRDNLDTLRAALSDLQAQLAAKERECEELEKALARYLAEKSQPGSDRRAECAALKSLQQLAATEVPHA